MESFFQDSREIVEQLFYHAREARLFDKTFRYGIASAHNAYQKGGLKEAAQHFKDSFLAFHHCENNWKKTHQTIFEKENLVYGEILLYLGEYHQARNIFSSLPENSSVLDSLGWIHFKLGHYPQATLQSPRLSLRGFRFWGGVCSVASNLSQTRTHP